MREPAEPGRAGGGGEAALDRQGHRRAEGGRERHLVGREWALAPLQHEHADHGAGADHRHADEHREALLAEPGDGLVRGLRRRVRRGDGSHALGDQPGDAFADAQRGPDRRRREAVVAPHHEVIVFADVDARDVDAADRRELAAHRAERRLDRTIVARELDQPQDAIDAAITPVVDLDDRARHDSSVTRRMFLSRFAPAKACRGRRGWRRASVRNTAPP